ncbi:hypothetical protein PP1Y_Lpl400 (plasmid) [Novosphingobium sp. PP1Y]|nr:hypothetical protein PP1Y_Lpl400 [Novosphingobium sp. PP1Y]
MAALLVFECTHDAAGFFSHRAEIDDFVFEGINGLFHDLLHSRSRLHQPHRQNDQTIGEIEFYNAIIIAWEVNWAKL